MTDLLSLSDKLSDFLERVPMGFSIFPESRRIIAVLEGQLLSKTLTRLRSNLEQARVFEFPPPPELLKYLDAVADYRMLQMYAPNSSSPPQATSGIQNYLQAVPAGYELEDFVDQVQEDPETLVTIYPTFLVVEPK
ncbi:MAG: hypothetical protein ACYCOU_20990 [Sulfobacillus sp.]